jgi:sterol desaturase/sphingolipid hydroxylase (fatty acid hydroxylase superfamily)
MVEHAEVYAPVALAAVFLVLLGIEALRPLRRRRRAFGPRFLRNVVVSAVSLGVAAVTVKPTVLLLMGTAQARGWGLLGVLDAPVWVEFALAFLLMDATFYYWHRANHEYRLLWRFHNVHHIDPDLDVSTSFRFHFVETAYSSGFRAVQVLLIGPAPWMLAIYELAFLSATMFHHSNLRIPVGAERWLNKVFVTPRMHGIHHSVIMDETNSNYSTVFRWWDSLNRSLRLNVPQEEVDIGVAGYAAAEKNVLKALFAMPFVRQENYWRKPDGHVPAREPSDVAPSRMLE